MWAACKFGRKRPFPRCYTRSGLYDGKKWIQLAPLLNPPFQGMDKGKKSFLKNMHFWVVLWLFKAKSQKINKKLHF